MSGDGGVPSEGRAVEQRPCGLEQRVWLEPCSVTPGVTINDQTLNLL